MIRKPVSDKTLDVKQRLTLFHGTGLSAEQALVTKEEDLTFEFFLQHGVKALNIQTAGIRPLQLKTRHGVANATQMRRLGFDALHLVDPVTCSEAAAAYGAADVISAFLTAPQDAVALSGSEAPATLNLTVEKLLEACAGASAEAVTVLQQATKEHPLRGVQAKTLLDTGVRASQLKQLGYGLAAARELSGIGASELSKLGFTL